MKKVLSRITLYDDKTNDFASPAVRIVVEEYKQKFFWSDHQWVIDKSRDTASNDLFYINSMLEAWSSKGILVRVESTTFRDWLFRRENSKIPFEIQDDLHRNGIESIPYNIPLGIDLCNAEINKYNRKVTEEGIRADPTEHQEKIKAFIAIRKRLEAISNLQHG